MFHGITSELENVGEIGMLFILKHPLLCLATGTEVKFRNLPADLS
jgi:hypothetical protein